MGGTVQGEAQSPDERSLEDAQQLCERNLESLLAMSTSRQAVWFARYQLLILDERTARLRSAAASTAPDVRARQEEAVSHAARGADEAIYQYLHRHGGVEGQPPAARVVEPGNDRLLAQWKGRLAAWAEDARLRCQEASGASQDALVDILRRRREAWSLTLENDTQTLRQATRRYHALQEAQRQAWGVAHHYMHQLRHRSKAATPSSSGSWVIFFCYGRDAPLDHGLRVGQERKGMAIRACAHCLHTLRWLESHGPASDAEAWYILMMPVWERAARGPAALCDPDLEHTARSIETTLALLHPPVQCARAPRRCFLSRLR